MRHQFLLILLLVCSKSILGQDIDSSNRRSPFDLKLFVNDSVFYNARMAETYYVINDTIIQIFPGEMIFIETEEVNGKLKNLKAVPEIRDKSKTIVIKFNQNHTGKVHDQMMLSIKNPFKKNLYYSARMNLMKNKKWVNTSVIPVSAGLVSYEMWPDIITSIVLTGFELKNN